jgi:hypothetical protein
MESAMFCRFNKKAKTNEPKVATVTVERKPKVIKEPGTTEKPSKKIKRKDLEIVLDTIILNELAAIESAVKSHQQRIQVLQKIREALKTLDQIDCTKGIKYITLESEGMPEQFYSNSNKPLLEKEALFL